MIADIARHGEPDPVVPYSDNPGLSIIGKHQAEKLGLALNGQGIDVVYTSPIRRARETGEIAASTMGLELIEDERLMEIRTAPQPYERSVSFWNDVNAAERILIVAHSGMLRHLIVAALDRPPNERHRVGSLAAHASVSTVDRASKQLIRYNDTSHLS